MNWSAYPTQQTGETLMEFEFTTEGFYMILNPKIHLSTRITKIKIAIHIYHNFVLLYCKHHSSELYSLDSGNKGTAAQQKVSLSLRSRQLPSEFHFRSVIENCGRGTWTQKAPDGVHMYKCVLPVQKTRRVDVGSQAATLIGSFCTKIAVSSSCRIFHTQSTVGILSLRVHMYWLSLLHDKKPARKISFVKQAKSHRAKLVTEGFD